MTRPVNETAPAIAPFLDNAGRVRQHQDSAAAPGFSEVAQANARQVEAFFEAQAAMTLRLQDASTHLLRRGETMTAMAAELASRLTKAQTVFDATAAWQDWLLLQLRVGSADVKRYLAELQLLLSESVNAVTSGWNSNPTAARAVE
jgi:hypothetical protein